MVAILPGFIWVPKVVAAGLFFKKQARTCRGAENLKITKISVIRSSGIKRYVSAFKKRQS
jgi:hypothetical protein